MSSVENVVARPVVSPVARVVDSGIGGGPIFLPPPYVGNLYEVDSDLNDASWVKTNVTISNGAGVDPWGRAADKVVTSSATESQWIYQDAGTGTYNNGQPHVFRAFVKMDGWRYVQVTGSTGFQPGERNFDLLNGTVSNASNASIEDAGNGWWRIGYQLNSVGTVAGRWIVAAVDSLAAARLSAGTGDGSSGYLMTAASLIEGTI